MSRRSVNVFEGGTAEYEDINSEAAGPDGIEIIGWYDEPVDWIYAKEEQYLGADPKEHWAKWGEMNHKLDDQLEAVTVNLKNDDGVNYSIFKWQMRDLKETVLIMREINRVVVAKITTMKTRKILGAPQEKFYARCSSGASFVGFLVGVVSLSIDAFSTTPAPSWLSLLVFLVTALFSWLSTHLAERWGGRERKIRKMQRISERRGIIDHAKMLIDVLDFDEKMLKKIAGRDATPPRQRLRGKMSMSDKNELEIIRDLRHKNALIGDLSPVIRNRIPVKALRDELERRKELRHGIWTELSSNKLDSHLEALKRSGPKRWQKNDRSSTHSSDARGLEEALEEQSEKGSLHTDETSSVVVVPARASLSAPVPTKKRSHKHRSRRSHKRSHSSSYS
jgi:hypothetical protein